MGLVRALFDFFLDEDSSDEALKPATPARSTDPLEQVRLAVRHELTALAAQGASGPRNRIHMLDLSKLAEHAPGSRTSFRLTARRVMEQTMRRRLPQRDSFTILNDFCALIVFRDASEEQGQLRCAALAREILTRLLGEGADARLISVHSARQSQGGEVEFEELPLSELVETLVDRAEIHRVEPVAADVAADEAHDLRLPATDRSQESEIPAAKAEHDDDIVSTGWTDIEWAPKDVRSKRTKQEALEAGLAEAINDALSGLKDLEDELAAFRKAEDDEQALLDIPLETTETRADMPAPCTVAESAAPEPAQISLRGMHLEVTFAPLLNVSSWLLSTYAVRFNVSLRGDTKSLPLTSSVPLSESIRRQIDNLAIRRAVSELLDSDVFGRRNLMAVQVHLSTLMHGEWRKEFLRYCGLLPTAMRNRLVWEIIGVPRNSWPTGLLLATATLKPFGRALLLQSDLALSNVADPSMLRLHAVGVDLGNHAMEEAAMIPLLYSFTTKARQRRLRTYITGCDTRSLTLAAIEAGFDYIGGTPIGGAAITSSNARPFAPDEIYQTDDLSL